MAFFIANSIKKHFVFSLNEGVLFYNKFFVDTDSYLAFKSDVDDLLVSWGCDDCITC